MYSQRQDKGEDVPVPGPEVDVDGVEDTQDDETPTDRVDKDLLSPRGELEKHGTEEEQVDEGPNPEGIVGWSDVGLFG
jgi:hypothetical protein